ncbi:expressed unknown protein [Seminavis robusta]|uniref:Uncharacterized protein n=1 Tax=Seminavis robusta TaxID=568900 RepID=A0A9N8HW38_9STRA|nr:expressed unknown protein [Seminavis robusta]|eukprot:Sro2121_g315490.1 n/a (565) ;mRNA; r:15286-16980
MTDHNNFGKDALERLTLTESRRRWQVLLEREEQVRSCVAACPPRRKKKDIDKEDEPEEGPFDLQSVAIPPIHTVIENLLEDYILQWQQLDFRKVNNDQEPNNHEKPSNNDTTTTTTTENPEPLKKKRRKFWHNDQHLKIPESFDYATRQPAPSDDDDNNSTRVVDLLDPTKQISYNQALWELFEQVPTLEEVEAQLLEGHELHQTSRVLQDIVEGYQAYSRIDAHGLSQMRKKDRHEMPPIGQNFNASRTGMDEDRESTITFECWRREPRRGPVLDPDMATFEMVGSQTLADLHQTIVELTEDELWEFVKAPATAATQNNPPNDTTTNNENADPPEPDSGYFFIEDTFYTIGSVDYVTPIIEWLGECDSLARRNILGISATAKLQIKPMKHAKLKDIPFRLGVRYHHACHGDVECAFFVTDRHHPRKQQQPQDKAAAKRKPHFPLLVHDTWAVSHGYTDCEGCQKYPVCVATSNQCALALGHRALCQQCSQILLGFDVNQNRSKASEEEHVPKQLPADAAPHDTDKPGAENNAERQSHGDTCMSYALWRNEQLLSTGAAKNPFF